MIEEDNKQKNFVGIYRNEVGKFNGFQRSLLLEFLTTCNFQDNPDFLFQGVKLLIKRGQLVTSFRKLAQLTGISLQTVRTTIGKLKEQQVIDYISIRELTHDSTHDSTQGITQQVTHGGILITIIQIDKFIVGAKELTHGLTQEITQEVASESTTNNNDNTNNETSKNEKQINDFLPNFEEFYKLFPNKKAKPNALKAYKKVHKEHEAIMKGLQLEIEYRKWAEEETKKGNKVFVPFWKHPATWLNQRSWEDEFTGAFQKQRERVAANIAAKKLEAEGEERKKLESLYHTVQLGYMNKKYGENGWTYFKDVLGNEENRKAINDKFKSLYPKEYSLMESLNKHD